MRNSRSVIIPNKGFILVRRDNAEKMGGFAIPGNAQDVGVTADIIAVPPEVEADDAMHPGVRPGVKIYLGRHVGVSFDTDGTPEGKLTFIKIDDILGFDDGPAEVY